MDQRDLTQLNVPDHTSTAMERYEPAINHVPGKVSILYVTHARDFDWLELSLRSVNRFAKGFHSLVIAIPTKDNHTLETELKPALRKAVEASGHGFSDLYVNAKVYLYDEIPGKGMIQHQERICTSDEIIPDADFVFHMDADCIMTEPNNAGQYFENGKPVLCWRSYESLKSVDGVVSDCFQWKDCVERALKFQVDRFTMCRHPHVYDRRNYRKLRDWIANAHRTHCRDYILSCRSEFPQEYAEHPTLGAFAAAQCPELYHWVDVDKRAPRDLVKAFFSHARPEQYIGSDWFNGQARTPLAEKKLTARQQIEQWINR